ncbi:MAG: hypothetical protein IJ764_05250 [Bacteroidales bacterium]|nr:hypothetical protein [Bacteroidales bacterium]
MRNFFLLAIVATVSCLSLLSCKEACKGDANIGGDETLYGSYKPYTRWWWFSQEIDTNDVRNQLIWLKEHEFGGVEIAWIYPMFLDTNRAHEEFLSEAWAVPVNFAKRMADSLGLGMDYTYGTMWPFSDVNLCDGDQTRNYFDSVEIAERPLTWDHPKMARIINHLDKGAFERYAKHMNAGLKGAYGGSRSGLFVDSWEVETDWLWTPGFGETFLKEHGYDVEPYVKNKTLYDTDNADIYYDYMRTLSGYVLREFYGPFAENATRNGAFSRSQCGGAPTDLLTAFTLVDIPETEAILYEPSFSKITASAASLGGKQAVTAETFTCAYGWTGLRYKNGHGHSPHQGQEQIADLKLICDALFANGTNQIIWHGFPYNQVGDTSNFFYTTCQVSTSELNNLSGQALTEFNRYMTQVSKYMRKGRNYSSLAVYMPLEDSWMERRYPDEVYEMMKWVGGKYEMRYINTPEKFKGMQPLWVNEHFLETADYVDGVLKCGEAEFKALYSDVEYMELGALKSLLRLAKKGMPVCLSHAPKEPGRNKHEEYRSVLDTLMSLENVSTKDSVLGIDPLISGEALPDFWVREDEDTYYVFVANPLTQTITYPLDYCYAFTDKGTTREIIVNHHGKSEQMTLKFKPQESLMLEITNKGVKQINLGYIPKKMRGYKNIQENADE